MSVQAMAWVLENSQSRGFARLVLLALANHHNAGTGQCNPGQRRLALEAGVSKSAVTAQIERLVELGEVEIEELGSSHRPAVYRLRFAQHLGVVDSTTPRSEPSTPRSGAKYAQPRGGQNLYMNHEPNEGVPKKRPTRIPDEFVVTPDMETWAHSKAPDVDWRVQTEKFVNYWKAESGARSTKLDWERTWRNWLLTAQDWTKNKSPARTHL